jgi:hypothetical protein
MQFNSRFRESRKAIRGSGKPSEIAGAHYELKPMGLHETGIVFTGCQ